MTQFFAVNGLTIVMIAIAVVALPTLIVFANEAFTRWLAHKETIAAALNAQTAERAAQYAAHTERLEQRMRVLERIVTDRGIDIADEIEHLRDEPSSPLN